MSKAQTGKKMKKRERLVPPPGGFDVGRPTVFRPEYVEMGRRAARLGTTIPMLAEFFGVSPATISVWGEEHPEFLEAVRDGRAWADANVADCLYRRATGYDNPNAVKILPNKDDPDAPIYARYTEHYPPDVTACIFWLKNRQPELWREKVEKEDDKGGGNTYNIVMQLPAPAAAGEDRSYRGAKVIEHRGSDES